MKKFTIAMGITLLTLSFATASRASADQQAIPNQNNVSSRSDTAFKNPKDQKTKRSGASKRAQLRKERDAQRKITVLQNRPSANTTQQ